MRKYSAHSRRTKFQANYLKLKRIISQNTNEFCENTTLHGLKYVNGSQFYATDRLFFGISVIAVIICSMYFTFEIYDKWNRTPVIIGINPNPTYIRNEAFPAVTICNLNQALKSKVYAFDRSSKEMNMVHYMCNKPVNTTVNTEFDKWNELDHFVMDVSQTCSKMIISCRFGGRVCNVTQDFYPIITDEGLCCVFNMLHPQFMYKDSVPYSLRNVSEAFVENAIDWNAEKGYPASVPSNYFPRRSPGSGESLGMSIILNAEMDEYYCSTSNSVGFKILMHSANESPNIRQTGVLIEPGRETKVRVRPVKSETEAKLRDTKSRYRRCYFQNEGNLSYFAHYTQRNCERECDATQLTRFCGCRNYYMPRTNDSVPICNNRHTECVRGVQLRTFQSVKSCIVDCVPACFEIDFIADVFSIRINYDSFIQNHPTRAHITESFLQDNIAIVNTYFKEHSIQSTLKTEFIGTSDFLSSVGGLIGLFIGFSFITISELIYFALMRPIRAWRQQSGVLPSIMPNQQQFAHWPAANPSDVIMFKHKFGRAITPAEFPQHRQHANAGLVIHKPWQNNRMQFMH